MVRVPVASSTARTEEPDHQDPGESEREDLRRWRVRFGAAEQRAAGAICRPGWPQEFA